MVVSILYKTIQLGNLDYLIMLSMPAYDQPDGRSRTMVSLTYPDRALPTDRIPLETRRRAKPVAYFPMTLARSIECRQGSWSEDSPDEEE